MLSQEIAARMPEIRLESVLVYGVSDRNTKRLAKGTEEWRQGVCDSPMLSGLICRTCKVQACVETSQAQTGCYVDEHPSRDRRSRG